MNIMSREQIPTTGRPVGCSSRVCRHKAKMIENAVCLTSSLSIRRGTALTIAKCYPTFDHYEPLEIGSIIGLSAS